MVTYDRGGGLTEEHLEEIKFILISEGEPDHVLEPTFDRAGDKVQLEVTASGKDTPEEAGIVATTLMVSLKQWRGEITAFHRLVMVDNKEMRDEMSEYGDIYDSVPRYGPSHFENPGDYIAAHMKLGDVGSIENGLESIRQIAKLFNKSQKMGME